MARFAAEIFYSKLSHRPLIVRHLDITDANEFLQFRRRIGQETNFTLHYPGMPLPSCEQMGKALQDSLADPFILNLGVYEGTQMAGHLNFRPLRVEHPWLRHIGQFGMMVAKDHWGEGIGTKLLQIQENHARQSGIVRLEAYVRVRNERAVALYQNHGFSIEGVRQKAAYIDGEFHDEYYIAKILT